MGDRVTGFGHAIHRANRTQNPRATRPLSFSRFYARSHTSGPALMLGRSYGAKCHFGGMWIIRFLKQIDPLGHLPESQCDYIWRRGSFPKGDYSRVIRRGGLAAPAEDVVQRWAIWYRPLPGLVEEEVHRRAEVALGEVRPVRLTA